MSREDVEELLGRQRVEALFRPIERATGLPGLAYTSSEFANFETKNLFWRQWVCAGTRFDLPEPGSVFPVVIAGAPLILVRGRDDKIRVFHNVCSHRGNLIVSDPLSRCHRIVCRYHSWAYDLEGTLRTTPQFNGPDSEWPSNGWDNRALGLKEVRAFVWHHWIFVNLDGTAPSFDEYLLPFDKHFDGYPFQELVCGRSLAFSFAANWKLVAENFLETLHVRPVHPGLFDRYRDLYTVAASTTRTKTVSGDYFSSRLDLPDGYATATWRLPVLPGISIQWVNRHDYVLLFPNLILFVLPDHLISIVEQPLGPTTTVQRWHLCFAQEAIEDGAFAAEIDALQSFWETVNKEDIEVCESMQRGRMSSVSDETVFSPYWEDLSLAFQRRVVERLSL